MISLTDRVWYVCSSMFSRFRSSSIWRIGLLVVVDCTLFELWKTEVIATLYLVWFADEIVGGSVVDIFWESEVIGKPHYVRSPLAKTWWLTYFEKRKKLASRATCGPPTKRGWYIELLCVVCSLFCVLGIRFFLWFMEAGGPSFDFFDHFYFPSQLVGGYTLSNLLDKPWSEVSTVPPPVRAFIFIAHRVQHSHCWSIFIEYCWLTRSRFP